MKRKSNPDTETVVLPVGIPVASNHDCPDDETKQLEFKWGEGLAEDKSKVWYVLLTYSTPGPHEYALDRIHHTWRWAHTKKWARDLARKARAEGFMVVDIFKGTKAHISHKFGGL